MKMLRLIATLVAVAVAVGTPTVFAGGEAANPIPPGTKITMQNWQQYKQFMPDGMVALFQGKYFWKMPADVEMDVGPTIIHPLPKGYREATEKYAAQVKLVSKPDGQTGITGYQGGQPFPNPSGPRKGWKILANLWFRYMPHLVVVTSGTLATQDRYGSIVRTTPEVVLRQLNYNTDPGIPAATPGGGNKYFTEWVMMLAPENKKYTADLTIAYTDVTKPQDEYVFIPSLRRYQPLSAGARCSPSEGTDETADDHRFGFNGVIGEFQAAFLGERKILSLTDYDMPTTKFPQGFDLPLVWPKPSWGKWQVRDVDVIDVRKIPAMAAGYCYGKRIMYIDKQFNAPLWEELYDSKLELWKIMVIFPHVMVAPRIGPVNSNVSAVGATWDTKNDHATYFMIPSNSQPFYLNEQAPKQFDDVNRYSTPGGLGEIMR